MKTAYFALLLALFPWTLTYAAGNCEGAGQDSVLDWITVSNCEEINPLKTEAVVQKAARWKNPGEGIRYLETYLGVVLVDSLKKARYFLPEKEPGKCHGLRARKTVKAAIYTACCDGAAHAPCLLGVQKHISLREPEAEEVERVIYTHEE